MTIYDNKEVDNDKVEGEVQLITAYSIHEFLKFSTNGVAPIPPVESLLLDWRVFVSLHVISNAERSSSFSVSARQKVVKSHRVKLGILSISSHLSRARGPPYN
ncbi:hypothetical protein TNCV_1001291 [Trichonephila clavipes]|nr:hypothetical protein TNCV_1001291 [Trichonephila clavipes]